MKELPKRLVAIDVFRALTMLLMIFVNDADGLKNIPAWIKHAGASEDRLGFADVIFPVFLFIVGLSLPFALKSRLNRGNTFFSTAFYILSRSVALIIMGFFHVNLENYSQGALLPLAVWQIGITISFFLIWLDYPADLPQKNRYFLIIAGVVLLLIMAILYQGGTPEKPEGLQPHWWGILGIIGWTYLVCAGIFLISKGKPVIQVMVLILFMLLNLGTHLQIIPFHIWLIGDASAVTLTMSGVVVSMLYEQFAGKGRDKYLWLILTAMGVGLILLGLLIRPFSGGISKIHATPAWVTITAGISILVFMILLFLIDIKEKQNWFRSIWPAGTSTLTCYLLPYILYAVYALIHFHYPDFLNRGAGGLVRSMAVAFLIIQVTGLLEKKKIRLKI